MYVSTISDGVLGKHLHITSYCTSRFYAYKSLVCFSKLSKCTQQPVNIHYHIQSHTCV